MTNLGGYTASMAADAPHRVCGRAVLCRRGGSAAKSGFVVVRGNVAPPPLHRRISTLEPIMIGSFASPGPSFDGDDAVEIADGGRPEGEGVCSRPLRMVRDSPV